MDVRRRLTVSRERLAELTPAELAVLHGGAPKTLQAGCELFSDLFRCFPTYGAGQCPPPPRPGG